MTWHTRDIEDILGELRSSRQGVSPSEAASRLREFGPNRLEEKKRKSAFVMFLDQFRNLMILLLLGAAVVAALLGDYTDSLPIFAIVVINAIIGFVQEYRAEKAMESLKKLAETSATVLRDGAPTLIPSSDIVTGDVVLVEAGQIVPADMRMFEVGQLRVEEATLTGESIAVEKQAERLHDEDLPLGDRRNMLYKGTVVAFGRGSGVVVATGMRTELGKIASLLQEDQDSQTPLQKRLGRFGQQLSIVAIALCAILFAVGLVRGEDPMLMFMTALTLVVAAIPEALPAVVTISLAIAAKKMVKQNALIRKLPAVETLGSVTYICTDKTGTLTLNKMIVQEVFLDGRIMTSPEIRDPSASCSLDKRGGCIPDFFRALALSNDAKEDASGILLGDPTETALYLFGGDNGYLKKELENEYPRIAEIPFDSDRKCMTTFHRSPDGTVISFTKGASDVLLSKSVSILASEGPRSIAPGDLLPWSERMASDGLRVLCIAMRRWETMPAHLDPEAVESGLTVLGLVGLMDPPREEAREAVVQAKRAGIHTVMITGDHPLTARTIARKIGILNDDGGRHVLTGAELAAMSPSRFARIVEEVSVYARVAPEQKLMIVKALQDKKQYVAMTGDGVNDAPALRRADIGVAMGITGADVSKQAADMVLLDDNFSTIIKAVREGRRVFDGITKMLRYILSTNAGEIMLIFFAPLFALPIPLLPIHILWLNLITDGLPSLAFAVGPDEPDIMYRPPKDPRAGILDAPMGINILWTGFVLAGIGLMLQAATLNQEMNPKWQTILFSFMCFAELGAALALTSRTRSFFSIPLRDNKPMIGAVLLTAFLQLCVIYLPLFNAIFKTEPLTMGELAFTVAVSSSVFFIIEMEKLARRIRSGRH